ncbi:iron-sulfur cluster repair protein YtfE [Herminiimonas fonticola]|uniref:iron-sulfur cluster repair protein YtfE n=1 Tax=Herminiimonas fonticola TaxID=303380 RepID=UPI0033410922
MDMLDQSLGQLARSVVGATRVFNDYQLDFCCGGKYSLRDAAQRKGIDAEEIVQRLANLQGATDETDWSAESSETLIDHILLRFHERHRQQLPELIRLARKVEQTHGDRNDCPVGLADHLSEMQQELESHMKKEEQILFPLLLCGQAALIGGPITIMRMEHEQHGDALQHLLALTNDMNLPQAVCSTWRALYFALRVFREDLMEHIHLENNILFENAALLSSVHA